MTGSIIEVAALSCAVALLLLLQFRQWTSPVSRIHRAFSRMGRDIDRHFDRIDRGLSTVSRDVRRRGEIRQARLSVIEGLSHVQD